jgi:hypothetical protein
VAELVFVSANLKNRPGPATWASRQAGADLAVVSEAHHRYWQLRRAPGRRYLTGPKRPNGMAREVGILADKRLPVYGYGFERLSEEASAFPSVGKERWGHELLTAVEVRNRARKLVEIPLAVVGLHPVAGPKALRDGTLRHPLVSRYWDAIEWLDGVVAKHRERGHEVVVMGDVQIPVSNQKPWSVHLVTRKFGLNSFAEGIDLIATTPRLRHLQRTVHQIGSDHPALRLAVEVKA